MALRWISRALDQALDTPKIRAKVLAQAEAIATDAKALAPKRTGKLARSIRAEPVEDETGYEVRVSWDKDAFYGAFQEFGTEHHDPNPFLRPAAAKHDH